MLPDRSLPPDYLDELAAALGTYVNEVSDPAKGTIVTYQPLVRVGRGLAPAELERAEVAFGCQFPPDFRSLLLRITFAGQPWAGWLDPERMRNQVLDHLARTAHFDVSHGYWHPDWGPRPTDPGEAAQLAEEQVRRAPALLPVLGHRFLPSLPCEPGNPVISMWQFVDTIYYGADLADYFHRELGAPRPEWARSEPREVPFWSSVIEWRL